MLAVVRGGCVGVAIATVFVVDDVPFGLVRTRAQSERARRGDGRLEHARLDTSDDCTRSLTRAGFEIDDARPAGPKTSTLWMVRAHRIHISSGTA